MKLKFTRRFSMAHRLLQSGSEKCEIPHGHNELVTARLEYTGKTPFCSSSNIGADFSELKGDWHRWIDNSVDHAFQLGGSDPLIDYFNTHEPQRLERLLITLSDPSTECLAALFLCKYQSFLTAIAASFDVVCIELCETPTNSVVINRDDLYLFPSLAGEGWWRRADASINDLQEKKIQAAFRNTNASLTSA